MLSIECQGIKLLVKLFTKSLRMSTQSAKLIVRGRASRSRRKGEVTTNKILADYLTTKQARAIPKIGAWTIKRPRSFHVREILPAVKSDSDSHSRRSRS